MKMEYPKASKYPNLDEVYSQCSGPGGLKLAEFIADKLNLTPGAMLLDIGMNWGYQTCFLAKEYGIFAIGIDPGDDPFKQKGTANVSRLMQNAQAWGVEDRILGLKVGVPDTPFAKHSFPSVYSTTTFEMIRGSSGEDAYRNCLREVLRILRPGGLFGYGDPMHLPVPVPQNLAPLVEGDWADCFATLDETITAFADVGFKVVDSGYAPDAKQWWEEYAQHDPGCKANPDGDPRTIKVDAGRWVSFGYVIARKP
jgi:cyclopropane fatty-acyl-phospholipid synthase-like methyltransferase